MRANQNWPNFHQLKPWKIFNLEKSKLKSLNTREARKFLQVSVVHDKKSVLVKQDEIKKFTSFIKIQPLHFQRESSRVENFLMVCIRLYG